MTNYNKHAKAEVAYRLSWMNATAEKQTIKVKAAFYDSSNALDSESVIATVTMAPGEDGVIVGTVQNKSSQMKIYIDGEEEPKPTKPTKAPEVDSGNENDEKVTKATQTATKTTKPGETLAPG